MLIGLLKKAVCQKIHLMFIYILWSPATSPVHLYFMPFTGKFTWWWNKNSGELLYLKNGAPIIDYWPFLCMIVSYTVLYQGGQVRCQSREIECPRSLCTHPMKTLTQCCPICDGCTYMRRHFRNGQKFVPPGNDNCKICRCVVSKFRLFLWPGDTIMSRLFAYVCFSDMCCKVHCFSLLSWIAVHVTILYMIFWFLTDVF